MQVEIARIPSRIRIAHTRLGAPGDAESPRNARSRNPFDERAP